METKIPDFIKQAIEEGNELARKADRIKELLVIEQKKKDKEYERVALIEARSWVKNMLPALIRYSTSYGRREAYLGNSNSVEAQCRVTAANEIGLGVRKDHYEASHDPDGAYTHEAGCSYYVIW